MSDSTEVRADRVASYKEERRKQLAAQFVSIGSLQSTTGKRYQRDANSSSSEGPRHTRASRLRAAAVQELNSSLSSSGRLDHQKEVRNCEYFYIVFTHHYQ